MSLDAIDQAFLELTGTPQERLIEAMGWETGPAAAEKANQIIRKYVIHKKELREAQAKPGRLQKMKMEGSGSRIAMKMLELSESDLDCQFTLMKKMGLRGV